MATALQNRVSDEEIDARAKMAGFIDRVLDVIQSTPQPDPSGDKKNVTSCAEPPATV